MPAKARTKNAALPKLKLKDLSPQAQAVVKSKKISGRERLKDWLPLLREVALFDQGQDQKRKGLFRSGFFMVLLVIAAFVVFGIALDQDFLEAALLILLSLGLLGLVGRLAVLNTRHKKTDLSNDLRLLVAPLLHILRSDIDPQGRIKMDLDLSGPEKSKIVGQKNLPVQGNIRRLLATTYQDPWCRLEIPLLAGGRIILEVTNLFVALERRYRSSRGKIKTKTKWKKLVRVSAGLLPDSAALAFDRTGAGGEERLKFKEKKDGLLGRVSGRYKFKAAGRPPEATATPDEVVGLLLKPGSRLKPVSTQGVQP